MPKDLIEKITKDLIDFSSISCMRHIKLWDFRLPRTKHWIVYRLKTFTRHTWIFLRIRRWQPTSQICTHRVNLVQTTSRWLRHRYNIVNILFIQFYRVTLTKQKKEIIIDKNSRIVSISKTYINQDEDLE